MSEGDWIYYQKEKGWGKEKIWRGPAKVVAVNGKKLFIYQGARLSTVNRDCNVRVGEEFWQVDDVDEGEDMENTLVDDQ